MPRYSASSRRRRFLPATGVRMRYRLCCIALPRVLPLWHSHERACGGMKHPSALTDGSVSVQPWSQLIRSKPILATALLLLAVPALAEGPVPTPTVVRGTVEKLDGQTLVVNARNGRQVSVTLAPNFAVTAVVKKTPSDIKEGAYLAATSVTGEDGHRYALEVHIFPEPMRGLNEGQKPWDLAPASVMTNATVTGVTSAPRGQVLKISYKTGETEVVVKPDTPVVAFAPGDAKLLQHGATVFAI